MGRRVEKTVLNRSGNAWLPESSILFVYNGYKLVEELDGLSDVKPPLRRYTWQPETLGFDVPLSVFDVAANATYFYTTDANKNVSELTDSAGNVVAHYEYSPFGVPTLATGTYAATNPFRFSSEYHDSETNLVYYNYRYYSPTLGRWLSRDPIGEIGGINLYNACNNNLVKYYDLQGMAAASETKYANATVYAYHQRQEAKEKAEREAHYNRNEGKNSPPATKEEAESQNWIPAPDSQNRYHQNNGADNVKMLSPDGKQEGVYDRETGKRDDSPENQGTYNYSPPNDLWGHFGDDVWPYIKWGNCPEDKTPLPRRIWGDLFD